jgi:hypothetical protein
MQRNPVNAPREELSSKIFSIQIFMRTASSNASSNVPKIQRKIIRDRIMKNKVIPRSDGARDLLAYAV